MSQTGEMKAIHVSAHISSNFEDRINNILISKGTNIVSVQYGIVPPDTTGYPRFTALIIYKERAGELELLNE